jgi:hypothetical protein
MLPETLLPHTSDDPVAYQIRLKGHLGPQWVDWFDGLTITLEENGETTLTGPIPDQAALHGLFKKVRDLGLPLLAVLPAPLPDESTPFIKENNHE